MTGHPFIFRTNCLLCQLLPFLWQSSPTPLNLLTKQSFGLVARECIYGKTGTYIQTDIQTRSRTTRFLCGPRLFTRNGYAHFRLAGHSGSSFQAPPCFLCTVCSMWQISILGGAWERGRLLVCTHDIKDRLIVPASDHSLWSDLQGSTAPFKGWRLNIGFSCVWYNMDYQPPDQPGKRISVANNGPFSGRGNRFTMVRHE